MENAFQKQNQIDWSFIQYSNKILEFSKKKHGHRKQIPFSILDNFFFSPQLDVRLFVMLGSSYLTESKCVYINQDSTHIRVYSVYSVFTQAITQFILIDKLEGIV